MFHIVLIFSVFHKCHGNTTQHVCHYICHNLCNITIVCVGVMTRNLPTTTQYNSFCHKVINCFLSPKQNDVYKYTYTQNSSHCLMMESIYACDI